MEIYTAVALGIVAGILVKALFLKESHIGWAAAFGIVGALAAYFLTTSVSGQTIQYVATLGTAVVVAGVLLEVSKRIRKTA